MAVVLLTVPPRVEAQDDHASRGKEQIRSIAGEMSAVFGLKASQKVSLAIKDSSFPGAEAVILEVLRSNGVQVQPGGTPGWIADSLITVFALQSNRETESGVLVETSVEATMGSVSADSVILKAFFFRSEPAESRQGSESTLFEQLIEPAVVIVGAFLIVYLLFTVRDPG